MWQPGPHPGQQNPAVSPPGLFPEGQRRSLASSLASSRRVRGVISGNKSLRKRHLPRLVCLPSLRPCGWTETESLSCPRKREGGIRDDSTAEASEGGPPAKPRTRRLLRGHSCLWGPQVPRAPETLSFKAVDTASRPWASRRCGDALPDVCDWREMFSLRAKGTEHRPRFTRRFDAPTNFGARRTGSASAHQRAPSLTPARTRLRTRGLLATSRPLASLGTSCMPRLCGRRGSSWG